MRHTVKVAEEQFIKYLSQFQIKEEVLNLYLKIVEEILDREDGNRKGNLKQLKERVVELDTILNGIEYKFVKDVIDVHEYNRLKGKFEKDKNELVMQITELNMEKAPIKSYLRWLSKLLPNMVGFFNQADNDLKMRMVSSIFPEKLIFENNQYRTVKPNTLLSIISLNINDLKAIQKEQAGFSSGLSCLAPPPRLERGTP